MEKISFIAEFVEAIEEEFTESFKVVGIYFGEGDPERGGQHWNFTQNTSDDEVDGVCTVKEIQQATVYGGITRFSLNSKCLICEFNEEASKKTLISELRITLVLTPKKWKELSEMAKKVFAGAPYFDIDEEFNS